MTSDLARRQPRAEVVSYAAHRLARIAAQNPDLFDGSEARPRKGRARLVPVDRMVDRLDNACVLALSA